MQDWSSLKLTEHEFKVYQTLLKNGSSTISSLSNKTNLNQRSVYDYIERLISKGLVGQIINNGKRTFLALNPEMISHLIVEEKKDIENQFNNLKDILNTSKSNIQLNYISNKNTLIKLLKKINAKTILLSKSGLDFKNEPNLKYLINQKINFKILKTDSKILVIFGKSLFLIYSIPESIGFYIEDEDFTENMKVYFP